MASHWRQEYDQQAALAREAGTADLQQERDAAVEKHQQLATELAEAVNARAAALIRAAAAEKELAAYRARVMATTGVQTDAVELVDQSAQAPAGNPMRLQLMPEGLEGTLHSSMPAKGVMVPATTSTPGGTVQGPVGTPTNAVVPRTWRLFRIQETSFTRHESHTNRVVCAHAHTRQCPSETGAGQPGDREPHREPPSVPTQPPPHLQAAPHDAGGAGAGGPGITAATATI